MEFGVVGGSLDYVFFFFQAEDGIRDKLVTGVQTCALPISSSVSAYLLAKTEDVRSETRIEEDNYVRALEWADSIGVDIVSSSLGYLTFDKDRKSVVWGKSVDLGGRRIIKKKKKKEQRQGRS